MISIGSMRKYRVIFLNQWHHRVKYVIIEKECQMNKLTALNEVLVTYIRRVN